MSVLDDITLEFLLHNYGNDHQYPEDHECNGIMESMEVIHSLNDYSWWSDINVEKQKGNIFCNEIIPQYTDLQATEIQIMDITKNGLCLSGENIG